MSAHPASSGIVFVMVVIVVVVIVGIHVMR